MMLDEYYNGLAIIICVFVTSAFIVATIKLIIDLIRKYILKRENVESRFEFILYDAISCGLKGGVIALFLLVILSAFIRVFG